MGISKSILGLPWQLAQSILQAASIPFKVTIGGSFNKFFDVANEGFYVGRVTHKDQVCHVLLYRPMINSAFEHCEEVEYAQEIIQAKQ